MPCLFISAFNLLISLPGKLEKHRCINILCEPFVDFRAPVCKSRKFTKHARKFWTNFSSALIITNRITYHSKKVGRSYRGWKKILDKIFLHPPPRKPIPLYRSRQRLQKKIIIIIRSRNRLRRTKKTLRKLYFPFKIRRYVRSCFSQFIKIIIIFHVNQ